MTVEIRIPSVGESIAEGNLTRWHKKDGDLVQMDEPLFELETEKATADVPAPATGRLRVVVPEGQMVAIGAVVGHIEEDAAAAKSPATSNQTKARDRPAPAAPQPAGKGAEEKILSPAARKIAAEAGLEVRDLTGTGKEGRVTKADVLEHLETAATRPEPAAGLATAPVAVDRQEARQRMSPIRQRIGQRLLSSQQTTATLTTFNEADLSAVLRLRERYRDLFKEKHHVGLGFMSFFLKACVEALNAHPIVNSRIDGSDIVTPNYHDIGVAVSTDRGLMVPVIRSVERLSFAQIERQLVDYSQKARDGKITVDDLQGGTFTVTNGGIFGSLLSTPILNPPQSAILGMHTIQKRPVAHGEEIVIRPMMYIALSYDHRLIDGRDAVLFLVRVKECIENPERQLLEV